MNKVFSSKEGKEVHTAHVDNIFEQFSIMDQTTRECWNYL